MASGSTRGGKGKGGRTMRSSHLAIRSVFQARRLTCHVPRMKAVIGIMAVGTEVLVMVSSWVYARAVCVCGFGGRGGQAYLV